MSRCGGGRRNIAEDSRWARTRRSAAGSFGKGPGQRFGEPVLGRPRLGQGAFRVSVMDAYGRACAISGGRVLPALEAAHIRPYAAEGEHAVTNGILMRRDTHSVFDAGYVTIDPQLRFVVSERVKSDFNNGMSISGCMGHGWRTRCRRRGRRIRGH